MAIGANLIIGGTAYQGRGEPGPARIRLSGVMDFDLTPEGILSVPFVNYMTGTLGVDIDLEGQTRTAHNLSGEMDAAFDFRGHIYPPVALRGTLDIAVGTEGNLYQLHALRGAMDADIDLSGYIPPFRALQGELQVGVVPLGTIYVPELLQTLAIANSTTPILRLLDYENGEADNIHYPTGGSGTGAGRSVSFTEDAQYLALGSQGANGLRLYKLVDGNYSLLPNPAGAQPSTAYSVSFTDNGQYMALGTGGSDRVLVYKRTDDTFVRLTSPSDKPTGNTYGVRMSGDGLYLVAAHATSPYMTVYRRAGDVFTKMNNPVATPGGDGQCAAISPDGAHFAIGSIAPGTPLTFYSMVGNTPTRLTLPVMPAGGVLGLDYSPDGNYLVAVGNGSPGIAVYQRNGDAYTKLPNPSGTVYANALSARFTPDGRFILVGGGSGVAVFELNAGVVIRRDGISLSPQPSNVWGLEVSNAILAD